MSAIRISNFSMRPAAVSDLPALIALAELAYQAVPASAVDQQALVSQAGAMLQSSIPHTAAYVAQIEDDIIGFGGWSEDQAPVPMPLTPGRGALMLIVHPRWRRRGVGRQIVKLCELTARRESVRELVIPVTLGNDGFPYSLNYAFADWADLTLTDGSTLPISLFAKTLNHA